MRPLILIGFFLLGLLNASGQGLFKTVIPKEPVIAGESFLVQYVLEDESKNVVIRPPLFSGFRLINGPNIYRGRIDGLNGPVTVQNFVYALEAGRPGKFVLSGATVNINGQLLKSNDVVVEVVAASPDTDSDYFLRPGEDPYKKIRDNLFLKVLVDKTTCFVGEPIVATFKLYSRLESKSDIVKNPGFYGFSVYDMINLTDREVKVEKVNGRSFDVHTVRKVQLYPFREGLFTIDPMEVKNRVEFSHSAVSRKTEQEIIEGVFDNKEDEEKKANTDVYETSISTAPVNIKIKGVPAAGKPVSFNGAVGNFNIEARLQKDHLLRDEEGKLFLTISGSGNFKEIPIPDIKWPEGIEGFEANILDLFDKTSAPFKGSRIYTYTFLSSKPGSYKLPELTLSFFNPDSGKYKSVATNAIPFTIDQELKKVKNISDIKGGSNSSGNKIYLWIGAILLITIISVTLSKRKRKNSKSIDIPIIEKSPTIEELLSPAKELIGITDHEFYFFVRRTVWNFMAKRFDLEGSGMNKDKLFRVMRAEKIPEGTIAKTDAVLQQCEQGLFTSATLTIEKSELVEQAKEILYSVS